MSNRYFYVDGAVVVVEMNTRKEMLTYLDDSIGTIDDSNIFEIQYADGSTDYIDSQYDGHKIKRTGIVSMVNANPETYAVYGGFEINEHGVVSTAAEIIISESVKEVDSPDYSPSIDVAENMLDKVQRDGTAYIRRDSIIAEELVKFKQMFNLNDYEIDAPDDTDDCITVESSLWAERFLNYMIQEHKNAAEIDVDAIRSQLVDYLDTWSKIQPILKNEMITEQLHLLIEAIAIPGVPDTYHFTVKEIANRNLLKCLKDTVDRFGYKDINPYAIVFTDDKTDEKIAITPEALLTFFYEMSARPEIKKVISRVNRKKETKPRRKPMTVNHRANRTFSDEEIVADYAALRDWLATRTKSLAEQLQKKHPNFEITAVQSHCRGLSNYIKVLTPDRDFIEFRISDHGPYSSCHGFDECYYIQDNTWTEIRRDIENRIKDML